MDQRLRELERQAQTTKNFKDVFAYYRELDRLELRRAIPVSWLGPSSRKEHNVRVHGNVQIAGWLGPPPFFRGRNFSPVNLWGKIKRRHSSSLIVDIGLPKDFYYEHDGEIQVTRIYLWEIPIPSWIKDLTIS